MRHQFNRPVQLTRFNFLPLNKAQCCCLNELHLHFGHQMTRFQLLHHPEYYEENRCFDKFINKHSFRLYFMLCYTNGNLWILYIPIYTWNVDDNINHITAQLITLHVNWGWVGCNIYFWNHIKQKRFLRVWILQKRMSTT